MQNARERHPYRWWHLGFVLILMALVAILAFAGGKILLGVMFVVLFVLMLGFGGATMKRAVES